MDEEYVKAREAALEKSLKDTLKYVISLFQCGDMDELHRVDMALHVDKPKIVSKVLKELSDEILV